MLIPKRMKTVLEVLKATTDYFTRHGVESARLNAEHLVAQGLGKKRIELYMEFDRPLSEAQLAPIRENVRKRAAGIPLQHILGTVEFHGRVFATDARALIPRPETELLMELVLREVLPPKPRKAEIFTTQEAASAPQGANEVPEVADAPEAVLSSNEETEAPSSFAQPTAPSIPEPQAPPPPASHPSPASPMLRILDVGTGSGVIALTLAGELPASEIFAVDVSPDALALAAENAARLQLSDRVQFLQSDLLSGVSGAFDLIVANLPYIPKAEIPELSREVQHDPWLALDGGAVGTEIIFRLIKDARAHLKPGGRLVLEIGHDQSAAVAAELAKENYRDIRPVADYQGALRFIFAIYG